jgi:osmotically inducible lipoprotein OsmB
MKRIIMAVMVAGLSLGTLTGCNTMDGRATTGIVAGGVGGGLIGSAVSGGSALGTGIGAVGGALVGHHVATHY